MSFWCGLLFVITASFSLNVLYHGLFASVPQSDAIPRHLLGSLHQPVRNGIAPGDSGMKHVSPPVFNFHHPFTALLPAIQALEIQVEVKQEETLRRTDLELRVETGQAVVENGLTIIETGLSVAESFEIESVWSEDIEDFVFFCTLVTCAVCLSAVSIRLLCAAVNASKKRNLQVTTRNELSSESFQTCPAKDAKSIKAKPVVKEEHDKSVREVIRLGESKDSAAKSESAPSEKEVYVNQPTLLLNLEHDVVIVLAAHLTLIVSILLLGFRSLHVQKRVINDDVGFEELIVTVGLISCITVALIVLMGATITLFIRILLAKFP